MLETRPTARYRRARRQEPACVLCVGIAPVQLLGGSCTALSLEIICVGCPAEALGVLERRRVAVLLVGPRISARDTRDLLVAGLHVAAGRKPVNIVLTEDADLSPFQSLVDEDRLFYLARSPLPDEELQLMICAAAQRHQQLGSCAGQLEDEVAAPRVQHIVERSRQLGLQRDMAEASRLAAEIARDLVDADRAYCLVHDERSDSLWSCDPHRLGERRESAAVGLASFVVRTKRPVHVERAAADPRYDPDADDPLGNGEETLVLLPIQAIDGRVLAVLVVVRVRSAPAFVRNEIRELLLLAEQCTSVFRRVALSEAAAEAEAAAAGALHGASSQLYRGEAVAHHRFDNRARCAPIQLSDRSFGWAYGLLIAILAVAALYLVLGEVHEYAEGPAVIRVVGGKTDITAVTTATVATVLVSSGRRVRRGDLLMRFHDAPQRAELARLQQELQAQLINRLRDPADPAPKQQLARLRALRDKARAELARRSVRAPHDGVVGDVRARPGRRVEAGQMLLSLVARGAQYRVVAMVPGRFRPQIESGSPLRLQLSGYERTYTDVEIARIGDQVVGPSEAKRYLGAEISDSLAPTGPVVLVTAGLASPTFVTGEQALHYHDGMIGRARIKVSSESILLTLVPGLKKLLAQPAPAQAGLSVHGETRRAPGG